MKVTAHRARLPYTCWGRTWNREELRWMPGRDLDGGPLPADHTESIEPGTRYVQWQQYGETRRMCEACARAAGVLS